MQKNKSTNINHLMPYCLKATESAAIACLAHVGKGDQNKADAAAVKAMRTALKDLPVSAQVVIGEGERDEAPMLYIGEIVGNNANKHRQGEDINCDMAVDPLEGTKLVARGENGALTVLVLGERNGLLNAPDVYMDKLAVGFDSEDLSVVPDLLSLDRTVEENVEILSEHTGKAIRDLKICVMDRPRNQDKIDSLRKLNAQVILIREGDVSACLDTCLGGLDMYLGIGAAPEGVLAAAALKFLGGSFYGKLVCLNEAQEKRCKSFGINDLSKIYSIEELAKAPLVFVATGVTDSSILNGALAQEEGACATHSLVLSDGLCRYVETISRV